jgi:hypothetical protein
VFVNANCACEDDPSGVAVARNEPISEFALHATVARPDGSVRTEKARVPDGKVHDGPLTGAAKSMRIRLYY